MNKKSILFIVLVIVLGVLSYLGYSIITKSQEKNAISKRLQTIPEFELKKIDGTLFTKSNLKKNTATVFIYFNSECDFCQHEAQSISDSLDTFKGVQFVFVSTESKETILQFSEQYKLNNLLNITFLYDDDNHFSTQFDAQSIPYTLIYDKKNELIKRHNGQLNAIGILRVLNQ